MMRKDLGYIRQQKDISEEKRMKKNVWIAGVTALLSAGLVWIAPVSTLADERIPDGVSVGAVSLSGLTEAEAEKQIESYVNEKLNQDITLVVNGAEAKSDAKTLGVAWDNQDEVAKAVQGTELKGNLVKRYMKKKDLIFYAGTAVLLAFLKIELISSHTVSLF